AVDISEWIGAGDWRLFFINRDRIKQVTPADVQRVARTYLRRENRTVGLFIPAEKSDLVDVPELPDVAALVKDYKGLETVSEGEAFDPSPANIDSRIIRKSLPIGLQIGMLPKRNRGNTVSVSMTLHFGDENSLKGRTSVATIAPIMLNLGTTKHTRQEIQDSLAKTKSSLVIVPGYDSSVNVTMETSRENLKATLSIAAEMLRQPSLPGALVEMVKKATTTATANQRTLPDEVATNELRRRLSPYDKDDVRYVPTLDEIVERMNAVTVDEMKKLYSELLGASSAQFAIVGDFNPAEVELWLAELFGDWKSPSQFARIRKSYQPTPPVNQTIQTPDKPNAALLAGLRVNVSQASPDFPALYLANYLLGGGFENSRLSIRIRQKEGLSYGVNSTLYADYIDPDSYLQIKVTFAPENLAKVETAVKEEIERVLKEGFTREEVETGKAGLVRALQTGRAQDSTLASELANNLYLDRTFTKTAELEKNIASLTPDEILRVVRRYIDPSRMAVIKAGDFAKTR
ncbi:MAG TPA: pitrilysin family protein, partial [Blastocatellia bacterium]|nr:pitrilysin family protein [Blastocatellia bacterium]